VIGRGRRAVFDRAAGTRNIIRIGERAEVSIRQGAQNRPRAAIVSPTLITPLLPFLAGLVVQPSHANPLGGIVVGGNASISGEGTALTTIHQVSDRAIINWADFSIGLGELTQFIQPGVNAAALNRVMSGNPSQLLGTLQANGQVFLINPNGVFVGPSGQINTHTFIGSTLDLTDGNFPPAAR
jgi:filamentous hemagglutinin family protein